MSKYEYDTNHRSYLIDIDSTGKPRFYVSSDGIEDWGFTATTTVPLSTWTHVAAASDGTTMKIYVNGVQDAATKTAHAIFNSSASLGIGAMILSGAVEQYFNGSIDKMRIYNYARTADEIRLDYNAGVATHFR